MKILLNYASNGQFIQSQLLNSQTGLAAGFNVVYQMSDRDIDKIFAQKNQKILSSKTGAGYWLWKSYFIDRLLQQMNETDILFYADSGSAFIKDMQPLFDKISLDKNGVMAFRMSGNHTEKHWTKRDIFKTLDAETSEYTDTPQRNAGFMIFCGTNFAKSFVREYLNFCCDFHLISDEENHDGWIENGFKYNRHDQSIWSVLTKKYGIDTLPDITQWGLYHKETTENDIFINHTRDRR